MFVAAFAVTAVLLSPSPESMPLFRDTPAPVAAKPPIVPVPLPNPSLSDADYNTALTALFADPAKRNGIYASLKQYLPPAGRNYPLPAHVPAIVELLASRLEAPNILETIEPMHLLARCGALARPSWQKVVPLTTNRISLVRIAAADALGGMFATAPGAPSSAPPPVGAALVHMAQTDLASGGQMTAAIAIGRDHIATPDAVVALASLAGGRLTDAALGALNAATKLGPDAHIMLPAIKKCLVDPNRVNNAVPALMSVASPAESIDTLADTLTATTDFTIRRTIVYYAAGMPVAKTGPNYAPLAAAILPLLQPIAQTTPLVIPAAAEAPTTGTTPAATPPVPTTAASPAAPVPPPTTAEELAELRVSVARAYEHLTGDLKTSAAPLAALATDPDTSPRVRQDAIGSIQSFGWPVSKDPVVVHSLVAALGDSDPGVQNAAITVLFKFGGPAAAAAAPRLSQLLLTAWQNKQGSRVFSLINALYRIGPVASKSATPVLKKIRAGEPDGSTNARYAELALQRMAQ